MSTFTYKNFNIISTNCCRFNTVKPKGKQEHKHILTEKYGKAKHFNR